MKTSDRALAIVLMALVGFGLVALASWRLSSAASERQQATQAPAYGR
jgi:hypothetical protein